MIAITKRIMQLARALVKDERIPRWLKVMWLAGLLPIPGPFDEIWLPVPAVITWVFYGGVVRELWAAS